MLSFRHFISTSMLAAGFALVGSSAQAHINIDAPLKSRGGGGNDQKVAPCEGKPRLAMPFTFEPGATISVGVVETIAHDGYFRIAFDPDGTDFKDPQSIDPINPDRYGAGRECQGTPEDKCGKSDFCSFVSEDGPTVLWDNLDPHLGAESKGEYSWTIKLPNIECNNCTLQVMQVMEDPAGGFHGPFDGKSDLYYRCIDIVLKKGAGTSGPGNATGEPKNEGMQCLAQETPGGGATDAGTSPATDAGATSTSDAGKSPADAGAPKPTDPGEGGDDDDDGAPVDAGTKPLRDASTSTPAKTDAGKRDAGTAPATEDDDHEGAHHDDDSGDDDAEEGDDQVDAPATDDGCSLAPTHDGERLVSLAALLALTTLLARRRRT
jgi:hypothetical protein